MMVRQHRRRPGWWELDVSGEEFHDIHHALRMLLEQSWLPPQGDEADRLKRSADQMWNAHCGRVQNTNSRDDA